MIQRKIGTLLASCGVVMLMLGVSALPAHGAEPLHVALLPSPRPAIDPLKHHSGASVEMGHITGTVIDMRTGAPAAGVAVNVGGDLVTTDANGNYDHWLPVGEYSVALDLTGEQGAAEQSAVLVAVLPAVPTVQHLNFRSSAPALSTPIAAAPATPAIHADAAPANPVVVDLGAPKRLPRTGSDGSPAWLWLAFGMLLLLIGGVAGFGPVLHGKSAVALVHAHAANGQLLQALLSRPARDEFLAALFDSYDRKRG